MFWFFFFFFLYIATHHCTYTISIWLPGYQPSSHAITENPAHIGCPILFYNIALSMRYDLISSKTLFANALQYNIFVIRAKSDRMAANRISHTHIILICFFFKFHLDRNGWLLSSNSIRKKRVSILSHGNVHVNNNTAVYFVQLD